MQVRGLRHSLSPRPLQGRPGAEGPCSPGLTMLLRLAAAAIFGSMLTLLLALLSNNLNYLLSGGERQLPLLQQAGMQNRQLT